MLYKVMIRFKNQDSINIGNVTYNQLSVLTKALGRCRFRFFSNCISYTNNDDKSTVIINLSEVVFVKIEEVK